MTVSGIIRDRFVSTTKQTPILRDGQIVQGKILKLFPYNRAEIQIGAHKMIAEIITSLQVGGKYFFQVQQERDQPIHLKVIGDQHETNQNITSLMKHLGLKVSKATTQLMNLLVSEKVLFHRTQIIEALELLDRFGHQKDAMNVVKEMITNRLPMTDAVFQALFIIRHQHLSSVMKELLTKLHQAPLTDTELKLTSLLEGLLNRSQENVNYLQMKNQSEPFVHLLKLTGFYNLETRLGELEQNRTYLNFLENNESFTHNKQFLHSLSTLVKNAPLIQTTTVNVINSFPTIQDRALSNEQFASLKTMIWEQLATLLPASSNMTFQDALDQNTKQNQTQILELLQTLAQRETYNIAEKIVTTKQTNLPFSQLPLQVQFLTHLKQYLHFMGLDDEYILKSNLTHAPDQVKENQLQTIKSFLIQMIQEGNAHANEKVQALLHFINGMQLQSIQESTNFLQATLQMPGEKIALPEDLFMQFEGRKTEDGKLDPEFCRILFILHLKQLKETIIDMHIQKRIVSVTIYNDFANISQYSTEDLNKTLSKNLTNLDYQLSTVNWRPLHEEKPNIHQSQKDNKIKTERFDIRI